MDFPFEMKELDVILVAGGVSLRVLEVTIDEAMSQITQVRAIVASPTDIDFEPLLDDEAVLTITNGGIPVRTFMLRLGTAKFGGYVDETIRYQIELFPTLHFLGFRRDTCKFRDQTTETIITTTLDENGVEHQWNNTRACASRPYTVQYRETDLDFVKRLLEYEGIYYTFDDDGLLQLGDASGSLPEVPGVFELIETSEAGAHAAAGVTAFERGATFSSGAATVNDYNWKTPYVPLLATEKSEHDAAFETYEYPVGYRDEGTGKLLAKLRLEAHVAPKRWVEGASSVVDFRAGKIFNFTHSEAFDFSGRYLLVQVQHKIATHHAKGGIPNYSNRFRAIPAEVPFRPPVVTPRPVIIGNHTAMVRGPEGEEIHTDQYGRMKVQFHWDREAKGLDDSRWIRALQETSSSVVIARVGWEATVGYVDGDPDRPMGLGRQINGQMTPEYNTPKFKNRMTLKTETYPAKKGFNELRMDDTAGKQFMDLHAQRDMLNSVQNDKTETIGNDYKHLIKFGHFRAIDKNQDVEIGANEKRQVGESFNESVEKDRKETIKGNETIDVKLCHQLRITEDDTEEVKGNRVTFVGQANPTKPDKPELMENLVTSNDDYLTDDDGFQAANQIMQPSFQAGGDEEEGPGDDYSDFASDEEAGEEEEEQDNAGENKGMIKRNVEDNYEKVIKGSYMKLAEGQISFDGGDLIEEIVKGVKHTTSEEANITQANNGLVVRTVKGNVTKKAKGRVTTSSKDSDITIEGSWDMLSREEKVEIRSKDIELVAESKFSFKSGDLLIELTPDTIKIQGDTKLSSGTKIQFSATPDKMVGT